MDCEIFDFQKHPGTLKARRLPSNVDEPSGRNQVYQGYEGNLQLFYYFTGTGREKIYLQLLYNAYYISTTSIILFTIVSIDNYEGFWRNFIP